MATKSILADLEPVTEETMENPPEMPGTLTVEERLAALETWQAEQIALSGYVPVIDPGEAKRRG